MTHDLGLLLHSERQDVDGAEAAYHAAIAADPGHTNAHGNLGNLLAERAQQTETGGGSIEAAAALCDEVVEHCTIALGPEHARQ